MEDTPAIKFVPFEKLIMQRFFTQLYAKINITVLMFGGRFKLVP